MAPTGLRVAVDALLTGRRERIPGVTRPLEHELVVQGRLEGQAPEIDPVVYFTDCDPTTLTPGDLVSTEIVDTREYDLVARPL